MKICGIDPSLTSCGIAVLERTDSGTVIANLRAVGHTGRDGASYADRSDRIVSQARLVVSLVPRGAELVVIEGPAYASKFGDPFDRAGCWWGIYSALRSRGTRIAVCPPQTRAMWATGKGNAPKADVLAATRLLWPNAGLRPKDDDNRADALVVASMGAQRLGWRLPFETKPRHQARLDAIAWPKEMSDA